MQAGGAFVLCMNGTVQPVNGTMRSIGCAVQTAIPKDPTMDNPDFIDWFEDSFSPHPFCDKCKRYYNPRTQHICVFDTLPDKMHERAKLIRWIQSRGEYSVEE